MSLCIRETFSTFSVNCLTSRSIAALRVLPTGEPWGLRDYGTGAWEGGDEGCDHTAAAKKGRADYGFSEAAQVQTSNVSAGFTSYEKSCPDCGATRIDQQLGLEPTPEEYVTRMVEVFREVRRVLASHGTVWLNLGDSYCAQGGGGESRMMELGRPSANAIHAARGKGQLSGRTKPISAQAKAERPMGDHWLSGEREETHDPGRPESAYASRSQLKPKDLVGIPWRVAFALQADGWYLRSDIIWAKPNPMPESVTDRPTKAHEYVFLLSKQPRYFFDQEAVRERYGDPTREWWNETSTTPGNPNRNDGGGVQSRPAKGPDGRRKTGVLAGDGSIQHRDGERWPNLTGRNIRSVWEIATQPYPEAHFATFPEELARRCIAAGTSERGKCPECGAPWVRVIERTGFPDPEYQGDDLEPLRASNNDADRRRVLSGAGHAAFKAANPDKFMGWESSCTSSCVNGSRFRTQNPCVVLDPFIGSGTVAHVARKLGRHAVGIDLNESYLELAARRLQQQSLFAEASGV